MIFMVFVCFDTTFTTSFLKFCKFYIFCKIVRPLGPFVRAAYLCRTIFFVNAVRVSGLSLPSARAVRRTSELSNRTIIITAAKTPTNLVTALSCGVPPFPRLQCWHIQNRNKHANNNGGRKEKGGNGKR